MQKNLEYLELLKPKRISNNATSAENLQERLSIAWWLVGFVDGEGTFSVNLFRNKTSKLGWQCFPEFVVTQSCESIRSLLTVKEFFGCGQIYINKRKDNHRQDLARYCVRSQKDLTNTIIPFFSFFHLKTAKKNDFDKFCDAIEIMRNKKHLTKEGLIQLAQISQSMNSHKKSRYLESSEAIR